MMLGNISLDGRSLRDFGVKYALCKNRYEQPEPAVETKHVDGRNGDILFYTGEFKNVDLKYLCVCEGDFDTNFNGFKSWLYSKNGYLRLEDDAFPDEYRMAAALKATDMEKARDCFELELNCKPQKFLKAGEIATTISGYDHLYNPTDYESKPLIKVTGTGKLIINNTEMNIKKNDSYMMIDCELMDCYRDNENLNADIELTTGEFFTLLSRTNDIHCATGMTIEIIPRWFLV